MTHYLVAQIKVNDDSWIPDYAAKVGDLVLRHGGKYLSRSSNITKLEGDPPDMDLLAILAFPDMNALQGFLSDPEYAPFAEARKAGSDSHFVAVDSSDAANAIPYLQAAG
ncbi:MAG: DUF1330 domain-containing protein [Woeseiaceae bacterium]|nr:DUF1330 domain-containing protein [Woeseiaceae bacterium]